MKVMNPRLVMRAKRLDRYWRVLPTLHILKPPPIIRTGEELREILVVDLHLVGDMIMLIPLLESVRRCYPRARISLLAGAWAEDVLEGSDLVDRFITYLAPWTKPAGRWAAIKGFVRIAATLRKTDWDIGIDVRGDVRQILLVYLAGCRRRIGFSFTGGSTLLTDVVEDSGELGHVLDHHERLAAKLDAFDGTPFQPSLRLTRSERDRAKTVTPFIGFHFGASLPLRQLPIDEAANLVSSYQSNALRLVIFCAPDLESYVAELLGRLPAAVAAHVEVWRGSLREFIVETSRAALMITMDSGPAHIASALGRRTLVVFGPNLPAYTGPRGQHVSFIERADIPCRPCDQRHCVNVVRQACLLSLSSAILSAADILLTKPDREADLFN